MARNPSSANSIVFLLFCLMFSGSVMAGSWNDGKVSNLDGVIPPILVLPPGEDVQQVLFATGVQIYVYNSTAWTLNNVSADLYNFKGVKVGFHYFLGELDSNGGRATWETYSPASRVTGNTLTRITQSKDSIDWLLIEATSTSGKKSLGKTNFVQRLYTQKGLAPPMDMSAKEGDVFLSNYTALYTFSASKVSGERFR